MVLAEEDVVIALAAGLSASAIVILGVMLTRYRSVVSDAGKSTQLAKNLWDAMNARLSVQDARIIDLMAKVEVYSVRKGSNPTRVVSLSPKEPRPVPISQELAASALAEPLHVEQVSKQTELQILESLVLGPKTSSEIRDIIRKSREHTARLMKLLYDRGMVSRNDRNKPYVYEVTERGSNYLKGS